MIKIDDNQLEEFLKGKEYARTTARNYAKYIRRVNREELTTNDINRIYENHSPQTKCKLRAAVRLLGEFVDWEENDGK